MGTSFYDLLHPKDVQKVKSQLTCFDLDEGQYSLVYSQYTLFEKSVYYQYSIYLCSNEGWSEEQCRKL